MKPVSPTADFSFNHQDLLLTPPPEPGVPWLANNARDRVGIPVQ